MKRSFVLEEITDKQYKDTICIDLIKEDKVRYIDGYNVGDKIRAHIGFRANLAQTSGRYYNSITSWRIEPINGTAPAGNMKAPVQEADDLPF